VNRNSGTRRTVAARANGNVAVRKDLQRFVSHFSFHTMYAHMMDKGKPSVCALKLRISDNDSKTPYRCGLSKSYLWWLSKTLWLLHPKAL